MSNFFAYLFAIAFLCVTAPIWAGAICALIGTGFYLMFTHPTVLVILFLAPFLLAATRR